MKRLYLIGGAMGVGKTAVGQRMKELCDRSVFLDGDWCWDSHPFQVTEETKGMVMENICTLLGNFLRCSAYETVIFCWVMHQQAILDALLSRLPTENCRVYAVSLLCSEEALIQRLKKDVDAGLRTPDVIPRSLERRSHYSALHTIPIDTEHQTVEQVARTLLSLELNNSAEEA